MAVAVDERTWKQHFQIQSMTDLDLVMGQMLGWPIGMSRNSPLNPEEECLPPPSLINCSFCTKHGGVWTSHPAARLVLRIADPADATRY